MFRSFGISVPTKFVDNQVESEDESDLNIDLDMLQVPTLIWHIFVNIRILINDFFRLQNL